MLELKDGRPADCDGRLEKEIRTYDFLDEPWAIEITNETRKIKCISCGKETELRKWVRTSKIAEERIYREDDLIGERETENYSASVECPECKREQWIKSEDELKLYDLEERIKEENNYRSIFEDLDKTDMFEVPENFTIDSIENPFKNPFETPQCPECGENFCVCKLRCKKCGQVFCTCNKPKFGIFREKERV